MKPLVALLAMSMLVACGSEPPKPDPTVPVRIAVPKGPVGLAPVDDGVWVVSSGDNSITKVSASGRPTEKVDTGPIPLRATADGTDVWVTSFEDGTLTKLGGGSVKVGAGAEGVTSAFGSVWVVAQDRGKLVRVDPSALQVLAKVRVEKGARQVVASDSELFISNYAQGNVIAIDPATNKVRSSKSVCPGPQGMAVQGNLLWVACTLGDLVVAVDLKRLKIRRSVSTLGSPDAVRATDSAVYVLLQQGPTLLKIDPTTVEVASKTSLGNRVALADQANLDLAITGDTAWVTSFLDNFLIKVQLP